MLFRKSGSAKKRGLDVIRQEAKGACGQGNDAALDGLFREVIDQYDPGEPGVESLLGWMVLSADELGLASCSRTYVPWFLEHYPNSLLPVRVIMACYHAENGDPDMGTEHARLYLREVSNRGLLGRLGEDPFLQRGASHAFLVLTAAYTELGARSYSKRIFSWAENRNVTEDFREQYGVEKRRLDEELQNDYNRRLDGVWEEFLSGQGGRHVVKLIDWCEKKKCPLMAERVDLLHGNFKWNPGFKVDEAEMLLLVLNTAQDRSGMGLLR